MVFYDIFSKKKERKQEQQKIIVDYREKSSLVITHLLSMSARIEFENLQVGDYIINNLIIERKTYADFKASIIDKRIFNQIKNLQLYSPCLLILEGFFEEPFSSPKINENSIRGILLSLLLKQGIPMLFTSNAKDTASYIKLLSLKKENAPASNRPKKIFLNEKEKQQFILEGFSGIGPITSEKLLFHFGSLYNIFMATEEELAKIIGKKAKEVYSLIHLNSSRVV